MKRKFKNKELEEILTGAAHLANYPMPGDLTLAVISTRAALKKAYDTYYEKSGKVGLSLCEKDINGNPITVFQKDAQGNDQLQLPKKLKFSDAAREQSALEELRKLGEEEVEIELREFDSLVLESLRNITPIQMEALVALVEIRYKNREVKPLQLTSANGVY